jgi:hypothetical protein
LKYLSVIIRDLNIQRSSSAPQAASDDSCPSGTTKCMARATPAAGEWKLQSWLLPDLDPGRIVPDRGTHRHMTTATAYSLQYIGTYVRFDRTLLVLLLWWCVSVAAAVCATGALPAGFGASVALGEGSKVYVGDPTRPSYKRDEAAASASAPPDGGARYDPSFHANSPFSNQHDALTKTGSGQNTWGKR